MAEKVNKLIFETEFKSTGDLAASAQKIEEYKKEVSQATAGTLQFVEAEKKLEKAAAQTGVVISTETKKVTDLENTFKKAGDAMGKLGQTNTLKNLPITLEGATKKVKEFTSEILKVGASGGNIDVVTKKMEAFLNTLPDDIRNNVLDQLGNDASRLANTIDKPTARLRELKRLILTETDPVVIKRLQIEAGKLQDEIGDTNELIKALSSDTFFADTLVEGVQSATGVFATFQGVTGLLAEDQQAFAEASAKAQSALALLQGVQQISNALKKEDNIITRAQIIAQRAYALVVGESTGAMKGFRIALASTGIGALILAIGLLVANFKEIKSALGLGVNPELEKYAVASRKASQAALDSLESFKQQEEFLRNFSVNDEDIINKRIQLTETSIEKLADQAKKEIAILEDLKAKRLSDQSSLSANPLENLFKAFTSPVAITQEEVDEQQKLVDDIVAKQKALAVESKSLSDELVKIEQDKAEKLREELKKQNDDRLRQLSEEERHALALAGINRAGEEKLLKIRLDYAKKKQAILKSTPGIDLTTLKNAANAIKEIELELSKNQKGSIKALSDRVSNLREQITNELVIGSDEFKTAIDQYFILYKELQEANKALEPVDQEANKALEPVDVEIFVPGSLNQLQQEVDRLNEIISGLAPDDAEFAGALEKLNIAKAKLKELNDLINAEAEKDNTSQRLLEILSEEERHALALAGIRKKSEEDKLRIQLEYAQKRLDALKAETELNEVEILKTENIISELSEQLQNSIGKITFKDAFLKLSGEIQSLVSEVFNASNTIINIRQKENDALISMQQKRVSDAEKIADRGNARILELEQKRLEDLNKERAKFVRRQQQLAAAQLVVESLLAIAKAAAQGGAAAPFTIATTLIALAAGLASARATATAATSAQSFRKGGTSKPGIGGYTGDGPPDGQSLALGSKNYVYHNQEHITPYEVLRIGTNRDWLEKIRLERLDIGQLVAQKNKVVVTEVPSQPSVEEKVEINLHLNSKGIIQIAEKNNRRKAKINFRK